MMHEIDFRSIPDISCLTQYGFQRQSELFKNKMQKITPELTISSLYCQLAVLPNTLNALDFLEKLPSKQILTDLHVCFLHVSWWPDLESDGVTA